MRFKSSKLQAPNSRETSSTKLQSDPASGWVWNLGLGASLVLGAWSLELRAAAPTPAQIQFFENRIRPILVENCYKCHSRQAERVKGGLLLDTRDGVLQGGESGPVIVPGDPEKSSLIKAVRYTDPDLQMPPKDKKLTDTQIADL